MKRFILKSLLYISVLLGLHYFAAWQADGFTDPYYMRFANGRSRSLILGTSRAAQGLIPSLMMEELGDDYSAISNFSFTLAQSPYGPVYLENIQKKLDTSPSKRANVFILSVDPWSLCTKDNPKDDSTAFRENKQILGKIKSISAEGRPNFEYLIESYADAWGSLFYRWKTSMEVRPDGWLKVDVPMDSISIAQRTKARIRFYAEETLPTFTFSPVRYQYLQKTIAFLQNYGAVYLVRLPVHPDMLQLEEKLDPDFNKKICALTQERRVPYWDFTADAGAFVFTDGNHLYQESSMAVSRSLARRIRSDSDSDCLCEK